MSNPVGWFEIYVQDMPRAKAFYEAVLATKLSKLEAPMPGLELWAFDADMNSYGCGGALAKMEGVPSGVPSTLVYFSCKDCADAESRVAKAGGQVVKSKFSIGQYGFVTIGTDTEGNTFGLHSMV